MDDVNELIKGGYDLHVHSAPDVLPRKMDDLEMGKRITDGPLAGYAIKNHWTMTAYRAQIVHQLYPECDAVGTITLNSAVGGINPSAVEMACRAGIRLVWFPTCDNEHEIAYQFNGDPNKKRAFWASIILEMRAAGINTPTINILDENGRLRPEVYDVLDIIKKYDVILATGHLSHEEAFKLVSAASERGVKKIIITHVTFPTTYYTVDEQKEFLKYGAVMEQCYTTWKTGKCSFETVASMIREIGASNCILATDLGNTALCYPDEGIAEFAQKLLECGFKEEDIRNMVVRNPRMLLNKEN